MGLATLPAHLFVSHPLLLLFYGHIVDRVATVYPVISRIAEEAVSRLAVLEQGNLFARLFGLGKEIG